MKTITLISAFLLTAALSSATTITFSEVALSSGTPVTNQYSGLGITVQNAYFYIDGRDTFDQKGISVSSSPGIVSFTTLANALSIDYWVISGHSGTYSVFDSGHTLLDSFLINATDGDLLGAHSFSGANIATLEFSGNYGYTQVSTLRFNGGSSVPEPSTWVLLGCGLIGLGAVRRFRQV
jgi:hypothetical protein